MITHHFPDFPLERLTIDQLMAATRELVSQAVLAASDPHGSQLIAARFGTHRNQAEMIALPASEQDWVAAHWTRRSGWNTEGLFDWTVLSPQQQQQLHGQSIVKYLLTHELHEVLDPLSRDYTYMRSEDIRQWWRLFIEAYCLDGLDLSRKILDQVTYFFETRLKKIADAPTLLKVSALLNQLDYETVDCRACLGIVREWAKR